MVGKFDVQVGGVSHWEIRCGAGVNGRDLMMNGCRWGGGGKKGETNDPENDRRKRLDRRASLKLLSISNNILGAEVSMSKVLISPPYNPDKPHALVAGNHHTSIRQLFII